MKKHELIPQPAGPEVFLRLRRQIFTANSIIGTIDFVPVSHRQYIGKTKKSVSSATFKTLELNWKGNKVCESCIPPGIHPFDYKTNGGFFKIYSAPPMNHECVGRVNKVKGRSQILCHRGNTPADTKGCILIGTSISAVPDKIENSAKAYEKFYQEINRLRPAYILIEQPDDGNDESQSG